MILFNGYYGKLNTGDDAFVEVSSWAAKNIWKKDKYRFLTVTEKLPDTINQAKGYWFSLPKTYRFQTNLLMKQASHFISAGGSTFHSALSPRSVRNIAVGTKQNWNKELKIGAVGVSLGPFRNLQDERAVISYLKGLDFLALRDRISYDFACSLSLPYEPVEAFDMAAILPDIYGEDVVINADKRVNPIVGVSLCRYESYLQNGNISNEQRRNSQLEGLIKELNTNGVKFRFFVFNGHHKVGDREITLQTIKRCNVANYEIVEYTKKTKEMYSSIQDCDFVLSTRLHAAIFACFAKVPFMLVEYHRKCTDFLNDMGVANEYKLNDADFESKQIADTINGILFERNYQEPLNLSEMQRRAYRNFTDIKL